MLEIQKYLATHTPAELEAEFGIGCNRHPEFPDLAMFKYAQRNSNMSERIVQESRGIILDESDGWSVVSRPYDKFFNLGEPNASPIDWPSARVYEKLDGSLMTLYFYAGEWRVASSGMPDAGGPVGVGKLTFAELFWRVWNKMGYTLPGQKKYPSFLTGKPAAIEASAGSASKWLGTRCRVGPASVEANIPTLRARQEPILEAVEDHTKLCLMFELCSPHNRVVVPHTEETLVLHGVRNVETGQEMVPDDFISFRCAKSFPLVCEADCVAAAAELKPMENEGYVVCDKHFNRVKIKSPKYVALAHAKEGFTPRRMLELVRTNEATEFLTYFPEMRPAYEEVQVKWVNTIDNIERAFEVYRAIPSQKDFAEAVLKTTYAPALFALRNKKFATAAEFLRSTTIYGAEKILGMETSGAV